jgi:hypothetical protein
MPNASPEDTAMLILVENMVNKATPEGNGFLAPLPG